MARIGNGPDVDALKRMSREASPGLVRELLALMRQNGKWWLLPAVAVILAAGILVWLAAAGAAPFLYPLF